MPCHTERDAWAEAARSNPQVQRALEIILEMCEKVRRADEQSGPKVEAANG